MAKLKLGRKFLWVTAGVALLAVPLARPGTFSIEKLFNASSADSGAKRDIPLTVSLKTPPTGLDPVADAVSEGGRSRQEAQKVSNLYGIEPKTRASRAGSPATIDPHAKSSPANPVSPSKKEITIDSAQSAAVANFRDFASPESAEENAPTSEQDDSGPDAVETKNQPGKAEQTDVTATAVTSAVNQPAKHVLWVQEVASGDSLDVLLKAAGIFANQRYPITAAIAEEFDLSHLRPGDVLTVVKDQSGSITNVELQVDSETSVLVAVGDEIEATVVKPDPDRFTPSIPAT